ncbi:hypothetical protein T484DRAFT_1875978, partial [Baffinella frigidus]
TDRRDARGHAGRHGCASPFATIRASHDDASCDELEWRTGRAAGSAEWRILSRGPRRQPAPPARLLLAASAQRDLRSSSPAAAGLARPRLAPAPLAHLAHGPLPAASAAPLAAGGRGRRRRLVGGRAGFSLSLATGGRVLARWGTGGDAAARRAAGGPLPARAPAGLNRQEKL